MGRKESKKQTVRRENSSKEPRFGYRPPQIEHTQNFHGKSVKKQFSCRVMISLSQRKSLAMRKVRGNLSESRTAKLKTQMEER